MNRVEINQMYDDASAMRDKSAWFAEKAYESDDAALLSIAAEYRGKADRLSVRLTQIAICAHVFESVRVNIGRAGVMTEIPVVVNPSMRCRECGFER